MPTAGNAREKIRPRSLFGLARSSVGAPSWYHGGRWRCSRNAATPPSCQLLRPTPSAARSPPLSPSRCSLLAPTPSLPFPVTAFHCSSGGGTRSQHSSCSTAAGHGRHSGHSPCATGCQPPALPTPPGNSQDNPASEELLKNTSPSARSAPANEASWSAGMAAA